jgi:hypothetical protein
MKPNNKFTGLGKEFWANVRCLTPKIGYTQLGTNKIKTPTFVELLHALESYNLDSCYVKNEDSSPNEFGRLLLEYFSFRAEILNDYVEPLLMDVEEARLIFDNMVNIYSPKCPLPMNKQKGEKKTHAYFTGIINMLIEANIYNYDVDYNPRKLTTITSDGIPIRTLSRWIDGAFPSTVNPIAIWEIKEYYYTTTFGSRVADGIYETQLDGMEIEELLLSTGIKVFHYLMIDSHYTWWVGGKGYLCRIVDLLHMGLLDEVLFGKEVLERLPNIVNDWLKPLK